MKLTDEQIKFLEEHNIELILNEMDVADNYVDDFKRVAIVFKDDEGTFISKYTTRWAIAKEPPKFELTREKVLEWANHKDQQDTFVSVLSLDWQIANYWNYDDRLDKYIVRQNGNRPLPEVVEEWYRGREL